MTEYQLKTKWKTKPSQICPKDCWCRMVTTIDGRSVIVPCGCITKETAEYFVKLHNESIA